MPNCRGPGPPLASPPDPRQLSMRLPRSHCALGSHRGQRDGRRPHTAVGNHPVAAIALRRRTAILSILRDPPAPPKPPPSLYSTLAAVEVLTLMPLPHRHSTLLPYRQLSITRSPSSARARFLGAILSNLYFLATSDFDKHPSISTALLESCRVPCSPSRSTRF